MTPNQLLTILRGQVRDLENTVEELTQRIAALEALLKKEKS